MKLYKHKQTGKIIDSDEMPYGFNFTEYERYEDFTTKYVYRSYIVLCCILFFMIISAIASCVVWFNGIEIKID